ncbi:MAG TPA: D-2-hydroxyacid dehydrogenase, partial [Chloroflexota bacterium]|nr:D-2-hydroxyacid dehydrogenase [Chloroflexota bacterium]
MKQRLTRVVITSPLEDALVEAIANTDPRLEVIYPADLIPPPRYPADHALPKAETPEQRAQWQALLEGAEVLFDFGPRSLADQLASWPKLRWIQATSAGVGQFAERAGLTRSEVVVTTASGIHARPLAEFVLMAILMFVKEAFMLADDQRAHRWRRYATGELAGKTVTVVGLGRIGREIARAVHTFDARVVGTVRAVDGRRAEDLFVDHLLPSDRLDEVLPRTDFLVLCCPHTPETEGLIGTARLALLKPEAVLINVARGAIVDEPALIEALRAGRLYGAALDVFADEPLPADSPLWDLPNVLICPHSASTAS